MVFLGKRKGKQVETDGFLGKLIVVLGFLRETKGNKGKRKGKERETVAKSP